MEFFLPTWIFFRFFVVFWEHGHEPVRLSLARRDGSKRGALASPANSTPAPLLYVAPEPAASARRPPKLALFPGGTGSVQAATRTQDSYVALVHAWHACSRSPGDYLER